MDRLIFSVKREARSQVRVRIEKVKIEGEISVIMISEGYRRVKRLGFIVWFPGYSRVELRFMVMNLD